MADYNRRNQSGGNRNFGKPRFDRERPQMHSATCANCGKQCEVPFRPNGNKPVLCRDCFQNNRGTDSGRPERRSFDRPNFNRDEPRTRSDETPNYDRQFEALNAKMDKILSLLAPQPVAVAPLESVISEEAIDEIVEEIQEEKKESKERKPKKEKALKTKPATKTKKAASSKKK